MITLRRLKVFYYAKKMKNKKVFYHYGVIFLVRLMLLKPLIL